MNDGKKVTTSVGGHLSFGDLFLLLLIGLKLAGIIDWSWSQVILLPFAVGFSMIFLSVLLSVLADVLSGGSK